MHDDRAEIQDAAADEQEECSRLQCASPIPSLKPVSRFHGGGTPPPVVPLRVDIGCNPRWDVQVLFAHVRMLIDVLQIFFILLGQFSSLKSLMVAYMCSNFYIFTSGIGAAVDKDITSGSTVIRISLNYNWSPHSI